MFKVYTVRDKSNKQTKKLRTVRSSVPKLTTKLCREIEYVRAISA